MYRILEKKFDLRQSNDQFSDAFQNLKYELAGTKIGFPGGTHSADVLWFEDVKLWTHFGYPPSLKKNADRYWNVFGLGYPSAPARILCEINSPFEGIRRDIGGACAVNEQGDLAILHRGIFRSAGMNKMLFWDNYRGKTIAVYDGSRFPTLAQVLIIGSKEFFSDLHSFVLEVYRIKDLAGKQPDA